MPEDQSTRKLFRNSDEDASPGSLSAYIAKHLKERGGEPTALENTDKATTPEPYFEPPTEDQTASGEEQVGYILHHLDSQLINNHLERYLPSPSNRLHMMRERIARELDGLEAEITQYRKLGGTECQNRTEALEQRKAMLLEKMALLDEKLNDINPFRGMVQKFNSLSFQGSNLSAQRHCPGNPWRFIPSKRNQLTQQVADMNGELETLQHILEEQLHDPNFSSVQLGRLVNQYDAQLKRTERLMQELQSQQGILAMLTHRIKQWIRPKGSTGHPDVNKD